MNRFVAGMVALTLFGCGPDSQLKPDDQVTVRGTAHRQDGSALAGSRAVLVKEPDVGELLTGLTAIVGSVGLACLAEEPPELCEGSRLATTSSSGEFSFSLLGEDTQGTIGQASTFNLAVLGPTRAGAVKGASRTERFVIQRTEMAPPDVKLWEPVLTVSTDADEASVAFAALPSGASSARVAFQVEGGLLWDQGNYTSGGAVDARFLEDAQGFVSIHTHGEQTREETDYEDLYESEAVAFTGQAGAPPSRHAVCTATGASGAVVALESCSVTDGNFVAPFQPPADSGCVPDGQGNGCGNAYANRTLTVDLGTSRSASLLVVRGLGADTMVESSTDGTTWSEVTLEGQAAEFFLGSSMRYVRLRSKTDNGTLPLSLAEVSVW